MDYNPLDVFACIACPLGEYRDMHGLFSVPAEAGDRYSGLAILAEAPGAQEAATGRPMVGKAGNTLMRALAANGLSRDDVLLLNRIRCQPPGNKINTELGKAALYACNDWTIAELEYYNPAVVILMGGTAIQMVFGQTAKVSAVRGMYTTTGDKFEYGARTWVAAAHPAARDATLVKTIPGDIRLAKEILYGI